MPQEQRRVMKSGYFFFGASSSRWLLLCMIISTRSADVVNAFTLPFSGRKPLHGISTKRRPSIIHPRVQPTRNQTPLSLSILGPSTSIPSTTAAILALMGSSTIGMQLEKRVPSSGILATLTVAAFLSNLIPAIPLQHALYDLCWSWILPASLTLLLLGSPQEHKIPPTSLTYEHVPQQPPQGQIARAVARVAGPFFVATLGSIMGCWASFHWATSTMVATSSWFHGWSIHQVQMAVSCLVASYVGGSVNLFATAKLIHAPPSLLSSLATADLIVMALYFSALSTLLEWNWLQRRFFHVPNRTSHNNNEENNSEQEEDKVNDASTSLIGDQSVTLTDSPSLLPESTETGTVGTSSHPRFNKNRTTKTMTMTVTTLFLLGTTATIGALANTFESVVGRWIPGTGCGVIALVTPLIRPWVIRAQSWRWRKGTRSTNIHNNNCITTTDSTLLVSTQAQWWADYFFLLFFASIGVGVDLPTTIQMGPSCLFLSLGALLVHMVVVVVGSYWLFPCQAWKIGLEEIWIASNAAIGGPVTAAAFCTRLKKTTTRKGTPTNNDDSDNESLLMVGRTTAATVWGIVGYAIGTTIGVGLYRFLGARGRSTFL